MRFFYGFLCYFMAFGVFLSILTVFTAKYQSFLPLVKISQMLLFHGFPKSDAFVH